MRMEGDGRNIALEAWGQSSRFQQTCVRMTMEGLLMGTFEWMPGCTRYTWNGMATVETGPNRQAAPGIIS